MTITEVLEVAAISFGLFVLGLFGLWVVLWLMGCWADDDDRNPSDLDLDEERYAVRNPLTLIVPPGVCDCDRCRPAEVGQWVRVLRYDDQSSHAGGG